MLHVHAMARVGEANSGHGCRKTPEFGLVEDGETLREACTNNESSMSMPDVAPCTTPTDFSSRLLQDGARWERRRKGGIGATYRKSPGQISEQCLQESSAPSLVTPRGRHLNRAAIQKEAKFGVWLKEHPRTKNAPVGHCCPQTTSRHCLEPPLFNLNRN